MIARGWLAAAVLIASLGAAAAAVPADPRVQVAEPPQAIADFTLTGTDGQAVHFSSLKGRDALVFFGFTHCGSVCPAAMLKLRLLSESLVRDGREPPRVVFISVDGERDTPAVLETYLGSFPGNFTGLTGDPKAVREIAARFKAVFFKGLPSDSAGSYTVEHSSQVYLVDAAGRLRITFYDATVEAMSAACQSF